MYKIIVKFEVKDYDTWKKGFDSGKEPRLQAGISTADILCEAENTNKVIVIFQCNDLAKAKAHLGSPEVKKGQTASGFITPPEIFFGRVIEKC
jgi:hypothetical protein